MKYSAKKQILWDTSIQFSGPHYYSILFTGWIKTDA